MVKIQHMVPIGRLSEFVRRGAGRAVMPLHHKRGATTQAGSESRPMGRLSRFLGASSALTDATASPPHAFLPKKRDRRSYGYHMLDSYHWDTDVKRKFR